jgi:hypothetical protein
VSLCPEAEKRASMDDAEFWEYVYGDRPDPRWDEDAYEPTVDEPTFTVVPCPVCGTQLSACGYDAEGLPMIHATPVAVIGDDS